MKSLVRSGKTNCGAGGLWRAKEFQQESGVTPSTGRAPPFVSMHSIELFPHHASVSPIAVSPITHIPYHTSEEGETQIRVPMVGRQTGRRRGSIS